MLYVRYSYLCFLVSLIFILNITCASETSLTQKGPPIITIQGQLLDSTTLKPIKDAEVKITLTSTREKKTYDNIQITNEEGQYAFKEIPTYFTGKDFSLNFYLQSKDYAGFHYGQFINKEDSNRLFLTYDFRLMRPADELTVKIKTSDAVDNSLLNKIILKLQEYSTSKNQFVDFKEGQTDEKGIDEVKLPIEYCRYVIGPSRKYFNVIVGNDNYITVLNESNCGEERNVSSQKIENVIDFSKYIYNFYLVDSKKTAIFSGILTDNNGNPMADIPLTVKLGERKG